MKSCLYECAVMHHRFSPRVHRLQHRVFMFYLDLDEAPLLAEKILPFSHNRGNVYSFRDSDHEPAGTGSLKERLLDFLRKNGVESRAISRVMLLTFPRVAGYVFNPISVYFCFGDDEKPVCSVAEVGNTFGEKKLYLLGQEELTPSGAFRKVTTKHFYVSPFSALDLSFDFQFKIPGEKLDIRVDDCEGGEKILVSALTGERAALNNRNLIWFTVKYPLVTLRVIFLIHWHALRLWLKGAPFHRKTANQHHQRDVLQPHASLSSRTK